MIEGGGELGVGGPTSEEGQTARACLKRGVGSGVWRRVNPV